MQCFTSIEIHPQGPTQIAALARAEAHAEGCASCARTLEALRAADADLAEGLGLPAAEGPCPDPETLAAWIDRGLPAGDTLEAHLSGCFECRADLLECLADDGAAHDAVADPAPTAARSQSSRRLRPGSAVSPWIGLVSAAAALLIVAGGLTLLSSGSDDLGERAELRTTQPAPPAPVGSADLAKVPGPDEGHDPVDPSPLAELPRVGAEPIAAEDGAEPDDEPLAVTPTPAVEPQTDPAPAPTVAPEPATPEPVAEPPADPTPDPTDPTPDPTPAAPAPTPVVALAVTQVQDVAIRLPGAQSWEALEDSAIPSGSELRASAAGAQLRTGQQLITLNTNARLTFESGDVLTLTAGQVVLEGRAARLVAHDGLVEVTGRALVEASRKRYGLRVLTGRARVTSASGEPQDLETGSALAATRGKRPRVKRGAAPDPSTLPPWARPRGRKPARGPRGPRGPGAGPGQKPGAGSPRNTSSPSRGSSPRSPSPGSRR